MILYFSITKEHRRALLFRYPDIRKFVEKTLANIADRIISERGQYDIEREYREYSDRRTLNGKNIHGRKMTQATKDKIKKSLLATSKRQGWKGTPLLEETRVKIGLIHKGKIVSKETRAKISKANRGKIRTEEQRQNMSLAKTGQKYKKRVKVNKN